MVLIPNAVLSKVFPLSKVCLVTMATVAQGYVERGGRKGIKNTLNVRAEKRTARASIPCWLTGTALSPSPPQVRELHRTLSSLAPPATTPLSQALQTPSVWTEEMISQTNESYARAFHLSVVYIMGLWKIIKRYQGWISVVVS